MTHGHMMHVQNQVLNGIEQEGLKMSKLTLDEAIKHCLEVAGEQELSVDDKEMYSKMLGEDYKGFEEGCQECVAEHRQLAEWLKELKDLREENKVLINECDRLIKEKGELLNKVSGGDVLRICQLEDQFEKAKQLLKAAVEDFSEVKSYLSEPYSRLCDKWRYEDEALKLIGDESNGP